MRSLTEEKKRRIEKMWAEHFTSGQIALEIGVTRSSVMGYVNRKKLLRNPGIVTNNRKEPLKKKERHIKLIAVNGKMIRRRSVTITPQKTSSIKNSLMELKADSCRFVIGEVAAEKTVYCCQPAKKNSYCEFHAELCYIKPRSEEKRERKKKSGIFLRKNALVFAK